MIVRHLTLQLLQKHLSIPKAPDLFQDRACLLALFLSQKLHGEEVLRLQNFVLRILKFADRAIKFQRIAVLSLFQKCLRIQIHKPLLCLFHLRCRVLIVTEGFKHLTRRSIFPPLQHRLGARVSDRS